jgi:hypothetical protein
MFLSSSEIEAVGHIVPHHVGWYVRARGFTNSRDFLPDPETVFDDDNDANGGEKHG